MSPIPWYAFALVAAVATAGYRVVTRSVMKVHSPWAYALLVNIVGIAYTVPFLIADWHKGVPTVVWPWMLVVISTLLWAIIMVLAFTSIKLVPVSRREQISQVELLFVLFFGFLFLHESITVWKVVGIAFVLAGAFIAASGRTSLHNGWRSKGVLLTVGVASLYALVAIVDKAAQQYFPTGTYTFLLYLLPGAVLAIGLTRKRAWRDVRVLVSHRGGAVLGATALSVTGYYLGLRAYGLADATVVYTVLKLATIFAVVGGLLFFKEERIQMPRKIVSAILVVLGAIIVAGGAFF